MRSPNEVCIWQNPVDAGLVAAKHLPPFFDLKNLQANAPRLLNGHLSLKSQNGTCGPGPQSLSSLRQMSPKPCPMLRHGPRPYRILPHPPQTQGQLG